MASEYVCIANTDYRSNCGTDCSECDLLRTERRRRRSNWLHWTFNERRQASNWIPVELDINPAELNSAYGRSTAGKLLWSLIILLVSFNVLDAVLTARALSLGFTEANPVMAGLFEVSVPLGMAMKFAIVAMGVFALWRFRSVMLAVRGMVVLTGLYGSVVLYHLVFQLSM